MSELDFNYTLFVSAENASDSPYEMQISTDSFDSQYRPGAYTILSTPSDVNDTLKVQLELLPGSDNVLIHDFNLGIFPTTDDPQWVIDIEYIDEPTGESLRKKKKNTEQAKIDAKPRPYSRQSV